MNRLNETSNPSPNALDMKTFMHTFANEEEREEVLDMLKLGSQFGMRNRAVVFFYGHDIIAYKRLNMGSSRVNEFLRIFSHYLTTDLEDDCPVSWEECDDSFWEQLILLCLPRYMTVSTKRREMKNFLVQLKRFVHWLDAHKGCSLYVIVERLVDAYMPKLHVCEAILNDLFLHAYPNFHDDDWLPREDLEKVVKGMDSCESTISSIFEVIKQDGPILTLLDLQTSDSYQIVNFPSKRILPGMLVHCVIGKARDELYWKLCITDSVYLNDAKKFIRFE